MGPDALREEAGRILESRLMRRRFVLAAPEKLHALLKLYV